jgi:hypothetical protein
VAADDKTETDDERIDRIVSERLAAKEAQAERDKKLKGMGLTQDVLDVIGDAVLDRAEARRAQRDKEREDADQPPSTSKPKQRNFLGLLPASNDE